MRALSLRNDLSRLARGCPLTRNPTRFRSYQNAPSHSAREPKRGKFALSDLPHLRQRGKTDESGEARRQTRGREYRMSDMEMACVGFQPVSDIFRTVTLIFAVR